jgi:hypothetical protein
MVGSLSAITTAVLSAKVAVVISGEVGRSAVYSSYSNGLRRLTWGMPRFAGKSSLLIFNLNKEVSAVQVGF